MAKGNPQITFRVSPEARERYERRARVLGMELSEWARLALDREMNHPTIGGSFGAEDRDDTEVPPRLPADGDLSSLPDATPIIRRTLKPSALELEAESVRKNPFVKEGS